MSETTTDPAPEQIAAPDLVPDPAATETTQAVAEPELETPEPEPTPEPKPRRADRHVANLTARLAARDTEVQALERRAQAAEALLQAGRTDDTDQSRQTQPDVEARATQIASEREFNRRLADIDAAGAKDLGKEAWEEAKSVLTGLGATTNQAFLEALAETANPAKVFAALADDSDELVALLRKSPAALAAQLGRIDARMETTTTTAKPVSNAPKPPARIQATAVEAEPSLYDDKMSMRDWVALREKSAPRSLGGRR